MANAKISDDSVFIPKTNVRLISGLAGYDASGNAKITGQNLVTSVINSNNSGTPSTATIGRIAFYGVGGDSLGGSSGLTWNQTTDTLAIGTPGGAAGLNADLELSGNYIGGSDQPELTFKFGATTNSPKTFKVTTQSDGSDQTWLLPKTLPSAGQVLKASSIASNDVELEWAADAGASIGIETVLQNNDNAGGEKIIFTNSSLTNQEFIITYDPPITGLGAGSNIYAGDGNGNGSLRIDVERLLDFNTQQGGVMQLFDNGTTREFFINANAKIKFGAFTDGSIPFFDAGSILIQDNDNLFFDASNKRLGIGTKTPNDTLEVSGGVRITGLAGTGNRMVITDADGDLSDQAIPVPNGPYDLRLESNVDDPNLILRAGSPPSQQDTVQLVGGTNMTIESNNAGVVTFTASSSGGGGGYQTLTPGASVTWAAGSGLSAELTPSVTSSPNAISMTGFSAGDSGALKIIPTTTSAFRLPANSKAAGGDIQISSSNPSVLEYFYDGTTFYWWPEANMIDPIYFPVINETGLVSFYVPNTYTGGAGNVGAGSAWVNSFKSNNLIGDLTRQGTDADDVQFVERDDATSTPAHFLLGSDGTNTGYFDRATNLNTTSFGADWTGVIWVLANNSTSSTSYGALMDGDKDDDEALYMNNRRLCLYTTGGDYIYSNFPSLRNAGGSGNDNTFDLQDEWIYFGLSLDESENEITFYIGCQATFDNASSTIVGFNGSNINIDANGLYKETVAATLGEDTWNNFILGAASGGSFNYEGGIGMAAVYNQTTDLATHTQNWNNTREYYYIT